jgi:hypothetical protein
VLVPCNEWEEFDIILAFIYLFVVNMFGITLLLHIPENLEVNLNYIPDHLNNSLEVPIEAKRWS